MSDDEHDLDRFVRAQDGVHDRALAELRAGRKQSHWMWFVFPAARRARQEHDGQYYAIDGPSEARAYLAHPVLGPRLVEAARVAAAAPASGADALFGGIDAMKARSSMTLFARTADDPAPFRAVLDRWFHGSEDPLTVRLLEGDA